MSEVSLISPGTQNSKTVLSGQAPRMGVIGFSARALAEACSQCGFEVSAIDHFVDLDLREICVTSRPATLWSQVVRDNPELLSAQINHCLKFFGANPILLGGGTESIPELIAALRQTGRLLGPSPQQLETLRAPRFYAEIAQEAGILFPRTVRAGDISGGTDVLEFGAVHHGDWLFKSCHGGGGLQVRRLPSENNKIDELTLGPDDYLQQRIGGRSLGATCVLHSDRAPAVLGVTESWNQTDWGGPSEFIYRGSWGPIHFSKEQVQQIANLARVVQDRTQLLGWLQFDFIADEDGSLWLLEINPRWTAGMEVLLLCGQNAVQEHLVAWKHALPPTAAPSVFSSIAAKGIFYAPKNLQLSKSQLQALARLPREKFADIPPPDIQNQSTGGDLFIPMGHPVLSVRASGLPGKQVKLTPGSTQFRSCRAKVLEQLQKQSQVVSQLLEI